MKLLSWNVNGLRALVRDAGLHTSVSGISLDIVCLQETKADAPFDVALPPFKSAWNTSLRRGYAGTLCLFRKAPHQPYAVLATRNSTARGAS